MIRAIILLALASVWQAEAGPATNAPAETIHWSTNWTDLFDGKSLANWAVTDFAGHGPVTVDGGALKIAMGDDLGGINWTNGALPKTDYEISVDAVKKEGGDFFVGLTFPVADSSCSLILGGWGGGLAGLSSLDDQDASENETTRSMYFKTGQWYHVVLRVTPAKIQVWLDKDKIIDVTITDRKVSVRPGAIYMSEPLGMATFSTTAEYKDFKLRLLDHGDSAKPR
ncbi:MAG TPA: DUF1080 domain-containing protein [Verrucomicrobiae bacterium]|jgi:hypothetical protein